jgi:ribosome-binding protein aMBF1 (putative translation factor)
LIQKNIYEILFVSQTATIGQAVEALRLAIVMIYPCQIRAARGLLGINQTELSRRAKVGVATVKRIERSTEDLRVTVETLLRIKRALEAAGINFIDEDGTQGPGVRLKKSLS